MSKVNFGIVIKNKYQAVSLKKIAENYGWKYDEMFFVFSDENIIKANCMWFSDNWNDSKEAKFSLSRYHKEDDVLQYNETEEITKRLDIFKILPLTKKCYIAGLIGDLPIEIYTLNFEKAEQEVEALGYIPVSPLKLPHNHDKSWKSYMIEDLISMLQCDVLYALKNIRFSPGGKIELQTAVSIGMDIIHQK